MSNIIEIRGVLNAPPQMSIGGEHTKDYQITVEAASANASALLNKRICITPYNGINTYARKRVKITGTYLGVHGVTLKRHKVKPIRIEYA